MTEHTADNDAAFDAVHLILCNAGLIDPDADSDALVDSLVSAVTRVTPPDVTTGGAR